jgi:hypothetical protein
MTEMPSNRCRVSRAALRWLKEAKEPVDEEVSYPAQLAAWGLEKGGVEVPDPVAPSQPSAHSVGLLVQTLSGMEAGQASQFVLSNPNLSLEEQTRNLARLL